MSPILIVLLLVVFAGLVGALIFLAFKLRRLGDVDDSNVVVNFASNRTGGRFFGFLQRIDPARGQRKVVNFFPRDYDYDFESDVVDDEVVSVIVNRDNVSTYPKGTLSKGRCVTFSFPNTAEELSESFRNTPFGLCVAAFIEGNGVVRNQVDVLRRARELQDKHALAVAAGEMSLNHLNMLKEVCEEAAKVKESFSKDGKGGVVGLPQRI